MRYTMLIPTAPSLGSSDCCSAASSAEAGCVRARKYSGGWPWRAAHLAQLPLPAGSCRRAAPCARQPFPAMRLRTSAASSSSRSASAGSGDNSAARSSRPRQAPCRRAMVGLAAVRACAEGTAEAVVPRPAARAGEAVVEHGVSPSVVRGGRKVREWWSWGGFTSGRRPPRGLGGQTQERGRCARSGAAEAVTSGPVEGVVGGFLPPVLAGDEVGAAGKPLVLRDGRGVAAQAPIGLANLSRDVVGIASGEQQRRSSPVAEVDFRGGAGLEVGEGPWKGTRADPGTSQRS